MIRLERMNDTIISNRLKPQHQTVLVLFLKKESLKSSDVFNMLNESEKQRSLVSVKRDLFEMTKLGLVTVIGAGRSTSYSVTVLGRLLCDINTDDYIKIEPDMRFGLSSYNFELIKNFPKNIFTKNELLSMENATSKYIKRQKRASETIRAKELQRLVIELSWKSSKIEGNTYTLLDTEKLILEAKEAPGHSKDEAMMILNHKSAFDYIYINSDDYKELTVKNLEDLHSILTKDLNVKRGLRNSLVGVTGSKYKPLDNIHQIREALKELSNGISKMNNPYTKALFALLGVSYIQPFEDGNKRTGRLIANAILMAYGCAPLSYRSVDEAAYRGSVLVFYELNSAISFKKIFIDQHLFATENYAV